MAVEQLAYGVRDAARMLGVSAQTLYRERREGRLRATLVRGRVLIRADDLRAWLAAGDDRQNEDAR